MFSWILKRECCMVKNYDSRNILIIAEPNNKSEDEKNKDGGGKSSI